MREKDCDIRPLYPPRSLDSPDPSFPLCSPVSLNPFALLTPIVQSVLFASQCVEGAPPAKLQSILALCLTERSYPKGRWPEPVFLKKSCYRGWGVFQPSWAIQYFASCLGLALLWAIKPTQLRAVRPGANIRRWDCSLSGDALGKQKGSIRKGVKVNGGAKGVRGDRRPDHGG